MQATENQNLKKTSCSLCGLDVQRSKKSPDTENFCCSGCEMVFRILKEKGELASFEESSLFKEAIKHGIISNPKLIAKEQAPKGDEESYKAYLEVDGLLCPACAKVIELVLSRKKGIIKCDVDYSSDLVILEYQPRYIAKESLLNVIRKLGYSAYFIDSDEKEKKGRPLLARMGLSFFCTMNIMTLSSFIYSESFLGTPKTYLYALLSGAFCLPILLYSAYPFFKIFFKRLFIGYFGMETLISISILSASIYSFWNLYRGGHDVYFDTIGMIVSLVLFGKHLEWKAKSNSKLALLSLHKTLPKKARKLKQDGSLESVYVKDVLEGDIIVASVGEKFIADGIVVKGDAYVDESLLTGEPLAKLKSKGSTIIAGTHLKSGSLYYRIDKKPSESTLHKILEYIELEIGKTKKQTRLVDRVTNLFVPFVCSLAFLVALTLFIIGTPTQEVFSRSLSILLISCPCAIGIAAPLVESLARKFLSLRGILVKSRDVLSTPHENSVWVYDKTGTITKGDFQITKGLRSLSLSQKQVLKSLASFSKHPLSHAISSGLKDIDSLPLDDYEEVIGRGLQGTYEGTSYSLGSYDFMKSLGLDPKKQTNQNLIESHLYFATEDHILSNLVLEDSIREEAIELIKEIPSKETILLSGDQIPLVQKIAKICHFTKAYGEKNPLEKQEYIKKLKEKNHVVFVGDGINDAPALASAHTGIAVYSAQDISLQVADVILTEEDMRALPLLPKVISKTKRIAFQNIFWSFFYNSIGVVFASLGYLKPLYAATLMVLSSLVVIFNSLRVKK